MTDFNLATECERKYGFYDPKLQLSKDGKIVPGFCNTIVMVERLCKNLYYDAFEKTIYLNPTHRLEPIDQIKIRFEICSAIKGNVSSKNVKQAIELVAHERKQNAGKQ